MDLVGIKTSLRRLALPLLCKRGADRGAPYQAAGGKHGVSLADSGVYCLLVLGLEREQRDPVEKAVSGLPIPAP